MYAQGQRPAPGAVHRRRIVTEMVWAWARVLGGLGVLGLLLWRLGSGAFLDGVRAINGGTLLAALGIGLLTTVFSAWRWCLVARGLGITLPLGTAVADYYRALFLNAALPGGVLGDVHRAVRHGRDIDNVGQGVRAVVLERSAGQVVLVTVGVTTLLVLPSPISAPAELVQVGQVVAALIVAGGLALGFIVRRRRRRATEGDPGGGSRWRRAWHTAGTDLRLGLLARKTLPGIMISSVVVLAGHLATFVIAARAAGSSAPIARLLPLVLLALLAMALPLNVGGWGPREGVAAWAFGAAGLGATLGLTVAVVYGALALTASLPGAGVLVVRRLSRSRGDQGSAGSQATANREPVTADRLLRPQPVA